MYHLLFKWKAEPNVVAFFCNLSSKKTEVGGLLRVLAGRSRLHNRFEASLRYRVRNFLSKRKKKNGERKT